MVRRQEQPCLVLIKSQILSPELHHLAGQPSLVQREDRVTSGCDDKAAGAAGLAQCIPERAGATVPLEKVQIIEDQRDGRKTERVTDLPPQLPIVSDFGRVETNYRRNVCDPLPQQRCCSP